MEWVGFARSTMYAHSLNAANTCVTRHPHPAWVPHPGAINRLTRTKSGYSRGWRRI